MAWIFKHWRCKEDGAAAVELALIFPILMTLLFGMIDIGTGLVVNKKVVASAHIAAGLLARELIVSTSDLDEAEIAAQLALNPYPRDSFGIDVASIRYDEDNEPELIWRETRGMEPNANAELRAVGLGVEGEGVLVVSVHYVYEPNFSGFITGDIDMYEVAVVRGRRSAFIDRE